MQIILAYGLLPQGIGCFAHKKESCIFRRMFNKFIAVFQYWLTWSLKTMMVLYYV